MSLSALTRLGGVSLLLRRRPASLASSTRCLRGRGARQQAGAEASFAPVLDDGGLLRDLEREAEALSKPKPARSMSEPSAETPSQSEAVTPRPFEGSAPYPRGPPAPDDPGPYRVRLEDEELFRRETTYRDRVKELKDGISFAEVTAANQHECIRRVMAPFSDLPYQRELELKRQKNEEAVLTVLRMSKRQTSSSTFCHRVVPAVERVGYRRKNEFSVAAGVDGDPKTVGFFVGAPRHGLVCVPADEIQIISEAHKRVARAYQDFIRASKLPVNLTNGMQYNDGGHWRTCFVSSDSSGGIMARVTFNPQQMTPEQLQEQKDYLMKHFSPGGPGADAKLTSLYFQSSFVPTGHNNPCELLFGEPHLQEEICGSRFLMGPESFFQTNIPTVPRLLDVVRERLNLGPNVTLLDLCCGSGLHSITLAPYVGRAIGVDVSQSAVDEAEQNARLNGAENAEFYVGKIEDGLEDLLQEVRGGVSVVLNPGRGGVNFRVIEMLRQSKKVRKVVYVSCQPEGAAARNFRDLVKEVKLAVGLSRRPFRLAEAVPVDMFPGTHCCEHVFVFTR